MKDTPLEGRKRKRKGHPFAKDDLEKRG